MKYFKKADVFSILNAEDAQAFIGKKGFFGNSLDSLQKAVLGEPSELQKIEPDDHKDIRIFRTQDICVAVYFIPEVYVHINQRPFRSMDEFIEVVGKRVGDVVTYRLKENEKISTVMITGVSETDMSVNDEIYFNGQPFTWNALSDFQWRDDQGNWQDFQIKAAVDA